MIHPKATNPSASALPSRPALRLGVVPRTAVLLLMAASVFVLTLGAWSAASAASGAAEDPLPGSSPHKKINRQVDRFARAVDDLLIDSEHALVSRGRNAIGVYVPGQGAVFAFEFSLVDGLPLAIAGIEHMDQLEDLKALKLLKDGESLDLYLHGHDDEALLEKREQKESKKDKEVEKDLEEQLRKASERREQLETRQYARVKEELVNLLAKDGDMLDAIPGDEWVTLTARPPRGSWGEKEITTVVIRVRRRDITSRVEDKIDDDTFRKRLVVEEYSG